MPISRALETQDLFRGWAPGDWAAWAGLSGVVRGVIICYLVMLSIIAHRDIITIHLSLYYPAGIRSRSKVPLQSFRLRSVLRLGNIMGHRHAVLYKQYAYTSSTSCKT